jgi:hypothetical protein
MKCLNNWPVNWSIITDSLKAWRNALFKFVTWLYFKGWDFYPGFFVNRKALQNRASFG